MPALAFWQGRLTEVGWRLSGPRDCHHAGQDEPGVWSAWRRQAGRATCGAAWGLFGAAGLPAIMLRKANQGCGLHGGGKLAAQLVEPHGASSGPRGCHHAGQDEPGVWSACGGKLAAQLVEPHGASSGPRGCHHAGQGEPRMWPACGGKLAAQPVGPHGAPSGPSGMAGLA